jgi:hypothetical protein
MVIFGADPAIFLVKRPCALQWNSNRLLQGIGGRALMMRACQAIRVRIHPLHGLLAFMKSKSAYK